MRSRNARGLCETSAALAMAMAAVPVSAKPVLSGYWSDHAVIQRGQPIVVEGSAAPFEDVRVSIGTSLANGKADDDGRFALTLPAMPDSAGPLELKLFGADGVALVIRNIVVGDVYLCSGQSNMEMPLHNSLDGWNQVQAAGDPLLRLMNIPHVSSTTPRRRFEQDVRWKPSTSETAASFSAVCYAMAVELRKRTGRPVGAINASWGGSPIRPWIDVGTASALYGNSEIALMGKYAHDPKGALGQFSKVWREQYSKDHDGSRPWASPHLLQWSAVPDLGPWTKWSGTSVSTNPIGTVWLRRSVILSARDAKDIAALDLGHLDDVDVSFVNAEMVGTSAGPDVSRLYELRPRLLRAGPNEILIAVTNLWGDGGFTGDEPALVKHHGSRLSLKDGWNWFKPAVSMDPARPPWDRLNGIGVMSNGMIAPLGRVPLAGMVWYQGESDVGRIGYDTRLKTAISGWRSQFGHALPVFVVQLAGFGQPQDAPRNSAAARLRDEQRRAVLATPGASLVTAVDLGERIDIHPANKKEVGRRLALSALGEAMPMPISALVEGNAIRLRFAGVAGAWMSWGGSPVGFEICDTKDADCKFVSARIDGTDIVLAAEEGSAARVRYAWGDSPTVNLVDERMIPPPTFQMDVSR